MEIINITLKKGNGGNEGMGNWGGLIIYEY